jgi:hypothetical protein
MGATFNDVVAWLLEPDRRNPGPRFFALRDLLDRPSDDPDLVEARRAVMTSGPVPTILKGQSPEGWWEKPGPGYATKYRGTVWQLIQIERLGADPADERVQKACAYVVEHAQASNGGFSASGVVRSDAPPPSYAIHCLNGNLLAALITFGWANDERVQRSIRWQALSITGEDPDFAYYKSGTSGPAFQCGSNHGLACAWGANKALRALVMLPKETRGPEVERAINVGAEFMLSRDPAIAGYPYYNHVSSNWRHFGLPISYWSDVIETLENLTALGFRADPRLDNAFALVLEKRNEEGRWLLENTINGRTRVAIETKGEPSKWVTLRALTVLRRAGRLPS